MSISVICPLYNSKDYIVELHNSLLRQKDVEVLEIKYILTNTDDGVDEIINNLEKATLTIVEPKDFSHSHTRENAAMNAIGEILVFITQDIIIEDKQWLYKLTKPIYEGKCEAAFSRQICDNKSIERYTRLNNYPEKSRVVTKKDIDELGITTFFFSDAASTVKKEIYIALNGYDNKDLLTNEDMYLAYKLIMNGYRIMYNSEATVIHSHDYKFNQLLKRYFDQGAFLADNDYLLKYKANNSAIKLLKSTVAGSIKEGNVTAFLNIVPNFAARYIGNKLGQNYKNLKYDKIIKYSSNKHYWERRKEN